MIIGVAIKHNGIIHRMPKPYRHIDIINYLRENTEDNGLSIKGGLSQGFYLDDIDKTYLNRIDAMSYAKDISGQLLDRANKNSRTLFSEDLW